MFRVKGYLAEQKDLRIDSFLREH